MLILSTNHCSNRLALSLAESKQNMANIAFCPAYLANDPALITLAIIPSLRPFVLVVVAAGTMAGTMVVTTPATMLKNGMAGRPARRGGAPNGGHGGGSGGGGSGGSGNGGGSGCILQGLFGCNSKVIFL